MQTYRETETWREDPVPIEGDELRDAFHPGFSAAKRRGGALEESNPIHP